MEAITHLILFDVDGTLLLSGGAGAHALDESFRDLFGVRNAMGGIYPHGKTDRAICREMFQKHLSRDPEEDEYQTLLDRYIEILPQTVQESADYHLMPGVPALLESLSNREDVVMGLGTGNIEPGARIKLGRGDLNRFFQFGGFGCDNEDRSRLIEIGFQRGEERVQNLGTDGAIVLWVIGDTWRDVEAGRTCGARTVAVATGGDSLEKLAGTEPDHLFADLSKSDQIHSILDSR
jgi:phosphoglycolate phosphatase-like HAD superfamily hydrolase